MNIKASVEVTTSLIGLYLINDDRLLLLEEAYMRVIGYDGQILKSELFDLVEEFTIKDQMLFIQTGEKNKIIELTK